MIDRSYLPYQSAREYTDRGMAKWMGFFISEHSSALSKKEESSLSSNKEENVKSAPILQSDSPLPFHLPFQD